MHMVTITLDEHRRLLDRTVGVTAYARAARNGALTGEAAAAANKAVDDVLLGLDA